MYLAYMNQTLPKSFFDLLQSSKLPVLVDFYADWCGPCKQVSPVIQQIASEMKGEILTVKINVDKKAQISGFYQVNSIPTIMLFKDGRSLMRLQGAQPYESLKSQIQRALLD